MLFVRFFTLFIPFYSLCIFAAPTINAPLHNEQQRQIFEQLQTVDTTIPTSSINKRDENITTSPIDQTCYVSKKILLHDARLLRRFEVLYILNRYVGKCNGIHSLTALTKELTNLYIEHGYITSRVYIAPQDISDGIVDLYALEGTIQEVKSNNTKTAGAFMGLKNDPLDLITLESSLEQVNRLRSNTTSMDLLPGTTQGTTIVSLDTHESLPLFGSLGINNFGSDTTGKVQFFGEFTWENLFGFSDVFSANLNTTDKQQDGKKSFGNSYAYNVPLGKWLWEAGFSRFTYDQTIYGLNDSFISHGESSVTSLSTSYKLNHTQNTSIELMVQLAQKKNESSIEGSRIDSATYNLSVGNIGLKTVYRHSSWEIYTLLNYYQGLNLFNPTINSPLPYDFSKWTIAVGATKYFNTALPINYQFSGYAQYSDDFLYAVEQISIGGAYSVRGFQNQGLSGNRGWYARNDVTFQMNPYFIPYVAYDQGQIYSNWGTAGGTLTSSTFGFRSHYRNFSFDVYHAIPLTSPNNTFDTDPFIGLSVSVNF